MVMKAAGFLLIMLSGGVLQSVTGFGLSVYAICLLPLLMPMQQAVVIVSMMSAVVSIQILWKLYRRVNIRVALPAVAASLITQTAGFFLLVTVEEGALKKVLGIVLIILAGYNILFAGKIHIKACTHNGVIAGMISGILTGMYNVGGPPLVMYYLAACEDKEEYTATLQASFIINIAVGLLMHALKGNITTETLSYGALGMAAILPGVWLGMKIFHRLDRKMLSRVVYIFLGVMGVLQLVM